MINKNFLTGRDRVIREQADQLDESLQRYEKPYMDSDTLADIADYHAINLHYDKMKAVVDYGLQLHPEDTDLLIQLAYYYLDNNQPELAQAAYQRIEEHNVDVEMLHAFLLYKEGNYTDAMTIARELIDQHQEDDLYALAGLLLDFNEPQKALDLLQRNPRPDDDMEYADLMAAGYKAVGEYEKAIQTYNRLLDENPYSVRHWKELGECYYDTGRFHDSIDACEFALAADKEYSPAHMLRGMSFAALDNLEKAVASYEKASLTPESKHYMIALYWISKEEWPKALDELMQGFQHCSQSDAEYAVTAAAIATCLFRLGKPDQAIAYADQAILAAQTSKPGMDPYHLDTASNEAKRIKAAALMSLGKKAEATLLWNQFLHESEDPDLLVDVGTDCIHFACPEIAYECFYTAWEMDAETPMVNELLFLTSLFLGRKEDAVYFNAQMHVPLTITEIQTITDNIQKMDIKNFEELFHHIYNKLKGDAAAPNLENE